MWKRHDSFPATVKLLVLLDEKHLKSVSIRDIGNVLYIGIQYCLLCVHSAVTPMYLNFEKKKLWNDWLSITKQNDQVSVLPKIHGSNSVKIESWRIIFQSKPMAHLLEPGSSCRGIWTAPEILKIQNLIHKIFWGGYARTETYWFRNFYFDRSDPSSGSYSRRLYARGSWKSRGRLGRRGSVGSSLMKKCCPWKWLRKTTKQM